MNFVFEQTFERPGKRYVQYRNVNGARFQPIILEICVTWRTGLQWRTVSVSNKENVRDLRENLARLVSRSLVCLI